MSTASASAAKPPAAAAAAAPLASREWSEMVEASLASANTVNPIRLIVDRLHVTQSHDKPLIPLSIGDPSVFGNLEPPPSALDAVAEAVRSGSHNGYPPAHGTRAARDAVAKKFSRASAPLTQDDVVLASGASGAIELCIAALCNPGDNILVPSPGFSLYETTCGNKSIEARCYDLLPDAQWECDLAQAATLVDARTRAILINNPSNPCGSVFSREHLLAIVAFAKRFALPIISDEIYHDIVFSGVEFVPVSSLCGPEEGVPVLTIGGISKQYLVPGWRLGWILVHDPTHKRFEKVREAILRLTMVILGPCSLIQAALPAMLHKTPAAFYSKLNADLEAQAAVVCAELSSAPGLRVLEPRGAMYIMVEILFEEFADVATDLEFSQKLLSEEFVFVLPGSCFNAGRFFRVVTCPPPDKLKEACARIKRFCFEHRRREITAE